MLLLATACDSPEAPSVDLSGTWDFSFEASSQAACPGQPALVPRCAGSGRLTLGRLTPRVDATHSYRAFCQSCREAIDYGVSDQPLPGVRLAGGRLEFELSACGFVAEVPESAQTVSGTVTCSVASVAAGDIRGRWTMSRQ